MPVSMLIFFSHARTQEEERERELRGALLLMHHWFFVRSAVGVAALFSHSKCMRSKKPRLLLLLLHCSSAAAALQRAKAILAWELMIFCLPPPSSSFPDDGMPNFSSSLLRSRLLDKVYRAISLSLSFPVVSLLMTFRAAHANDSPPFPYGHYFSPPPPSISGSAIYVHPSQPFSPISRILSPPEGQDKTHQEWNGTEPSPPSSLPH